VPASDGASIRIEDFDFSDTTTIEALVLPFPGKPESLAPAAKASGDSAFRRVWFSIDPQQLREQFPYPLANFMAQQITRHADVKYPIPARPPALDNGPHFGYAVQWFSFACIAIIGWVILVIRRRGSETPATEVW